MNPFKKISGKRIPENFVWINEPLDWGFDNGQLRIKPDAETDIINKPEGTSEDSAANLLTVQKGVFTMQTKVTLSPAGKYDAAALLVKANEKYWAKLCIEQNSYGSISVVSVVSQPWSDDASGELLQTPACWLRITRKKRLMGMHFSLDGEFWRFVRSFGWNSSEKLLAGVSAQSPNRVGGEVRFDNLYLSDVVAEDFRSGE